MCPIVSYTPETLVSHFTAAAAIYERNQLNLSVGVCEKNQM